MCDHCGCRAMGPIAELTADHEVILDLAWRVAETTPADDPARLAARDELVALLDVHSTKEELGLYPLLIRTGDLARERCDVLEEEHRTIHDLLARATFDRRDYFALAAHIEEEEMELFSGALFAFDDEEWEAMEEAHHAALHHHAVDHSHPHQHAPALG